MPLIVSLFTSFPQMKLVPFPPQPSTVMKRRTPGEAVGVAFPRKTNDEQGNSRERNECLSPKPVGCVWSGRRPGVVYQSHRRGFFGNADHESRLPSACGRPLEI